MIYDLSYTERQHRAIQREPSVGGYSTMRHCKGGCKRRRSIAQFAGDILLCLRCARRSVQP
jgi:hypothetical protein